MTLDDGDVQAIAERVAQLLQGSVDRPPTPALGLVDAATLARKLGVERDWVYAHAAELCAIRLPGKRGRLRFDLARVTEQLTPTPPGGPRPQRNRPVHRRPRGVKSADRDQMAGRRGHAPGPTPGGKSRCNPTVPTGR